MTLEKDYRIDDVADALGMSTRWVRDRIKYDQVEHIRRGRTIFFTGPQVEKLRLLNVKVPVVTSITTGRKRRSS